MAGAMCKIKCGIFQQTILIIAGESNEKDCNFLSCVGVNCHCCGMRCEKKATKTAEQPPMFQHFQHIFQQLIQQRLSVMWKIQHLFLTIPQRFGQLLPELKQPSQPPPQLLPQQQSQRPEKPQLIPLTAALITRYFNEFLNRLCGIIPQGRFSFWCIIWRLKRCGLYDIIKPKTDFIRQLRCVHFS